MKKYIWLFVAALAFGWLAAAVSDLWRTKEPERPTPGPAETLQESEGRREHPEAIGSGSVVVPSSSSGTMGSEVARRAGGLGVERTRKAGVGDFASIPPSSYYYGYGAGAASVPSDRGPSEAGRGPMAQGVGFQNEAQRAPAFKRPRLDSGDGAGGTVGAGGRQSLGGVRAGGLAAAGGRDSGLAAGLPSLANPLAAVVNAKKALPLAAKLDAMSVDFGKLDERYNQMGEALQAAQQPEEQAAIRREMNALEGPIREKMAELAETQKQLEAITGPQAQISPQDYVMPSMAGVSTQAQIALKTAYAQMGKPYVFGGAGPDVFDCSGLTMYSWRAAGVSMPHSASMQAAKFPRVADAQLLPGDLVYFGNPPHHVGMYVGNGKMINAPHPGAVVRIGTVFYGDYSGGNRP